jgi:hypothetical protein
MAYQPKRKFCLHKRSGSNRSMRKVRQFGAFGAELYLAFGLLPLKLSGSVPVEARDLVGVGHSAMFTDKDGKLRVVYHAHNSTRKIHPRHMYISTVSFEEKEGKEIMVIDKDYITPSLRK